MVRAPPCHGGGRGFESHPGRLYEFTSYGVYKCCMPILRITIPRLQPDGSFHSRYVLCVQALTDICESVNSRHTLSYTRDLSSAGRASALQAEGHRFEPYRSHSSPLNEFRWIFEVSFCADMAQLAEQLICNQQVNGSSPFIGF